MLKWEEAQQRIESQIDDRLKMAGVMIEGQAKKNCPVDTGRLRASITTSPVQDHTVYVGTNTEYAPYVELGTCKMSAQPYLQPALDSLRGTIINMFKGLI